MASLNQVTLIGHVGKDPEFRTFNSGDKVANFSLAMSEKWKDKSSGEMKEKTEWINVAVHGDGMVSVIERFVKKGSPLYVQGSLQTRKYEKNGADHYTTEVIVRGFGGKIVLLGGNRDGESSSSGGGGYSSGAYAAQSGGSGGSRESFPTDLDDEIPFLTSNSVW